MKLKTKMIAALTSVVVSAGLIGGGTYALFSATASNTGNSFTAGTLTIATSGTPVFSATNVQYNNMAPGDSGTQTINVENTGSLDAWVHVKEFTKTGDLFAGATPLQLTNTQVTQIPAHGNKDFTITYNLPKAASDTYQGKSGVASIVFEAVQSRNNPNQAQQWGAPSYGISVQNSSMAYQTYRDNGGTEWANGITVNLNDEANNNISNVPQSAFHWYYTNNGQRQEVSGLSGYFPNFTANNGTYTWAGDGVRGIYNLNPTWMNIGNVFVQSSNNLPF